jgi:hypothetical protein
MCVCVYIYIYINCSKPNYFYVIFGYHSGIVKVSNISVPGTVSIGTDLAKNRATLIIRVTKYKNGVRASILEQYADIKTVSVTQRHYLQFYFTLSYVMLSQLTSVKRDRMWRLRSDIWTVFICLKGFLGLEMEDRQYKFPSA